MELYTINIDGTGLKKITQFGGSNWAPFYLNDNFHIIFSSNFNATSFEAFDLYTVDETANNVERVCDIIMKLLFNHNFIQITYTPHGFDAFPMLSHNGKKLIWGSSRNGQSLTDLNLFLADWIN